MVLTHIRKNCSKSQIPCKIETFVSLCADYKINIIELMTNKVLIEELTTAMNGHNYYFWYDEQGCLYGGTEFKLEDLEELQNKFINKMSERIYKRYIYNFNDYIVDDYCKTTGNRIYKTNVTKIINKMDYICVKTDYKLNGNIISCIIITIHKILNSKDEDITYNLWDYEHIPCIKLNYPQYNEDELKMYDGLDYIHKYLKNKEKINVTETIIPSQYIEQYKENPSLIDELENNYAINYVKNKTSIHFDGYDSNSNIEHKIMLELGYENKLYNYIIYSNQICNYKYLNVISSSCILNNIEHMYKYLNNEYISECNMIKDYIKDNKIDMTKQLVLININKLCFVFNCKMFKTKINCLNYINDKDDECIKIDINNKVNTIVTRSPCDNINESQIIKKTVNALTFKAKLPVKPIFIIDETDT